MKIKFIFFSLFFTIQNFCFSQNYSIFVKYDDTPKTKELAKYLTDSLPNDSLKILNIHNWIINNIDYDNEEYIVEQKKIYDIQFADESVWYNGFSDPTQTCSSILANKKALCRGYAFLFVTLCKYAGIYAEPVVGYSKPTKNEKKEECKHAWVVFEYNKKWYLCDPTWDSGKSKSIFESIYYLKSPFENLPEEFLKTHCSIDPIYQLVNSPITVEHFFEEEKIISFENFDYKLLLNKEKALKDDEKLYAKCNRIFNFNSNENVGYFGLIYYHSLKLFHLITLYDKKNININSSKSMEEMARKALPIKNEMISLADEIKSHFNKLKPIVKDNNLKGFDLKEMLNAMTQFQNEESSLKQMYVELENYRKVHPIPKK